MWFLSWRWLVSVLVLGLATGLVLIIISGVLLSMPIRRAVGPAPPDLRAEDVVIPSPSGSALKGWLIRGRPGRGIVVVLHGVNASRSSMISRLRLLSDAGYSALAIDFQAHGESPGGIVTFGHLEALDARAAVDFARAALPGERVGVIGVSLGGAAALLGPGPLPVEALLVESVFPNIESALGNRFAHYLGPAGRLLTPAYTALMPLVVHVRARELRPIDRIGEAKAPVFVMSGSEDRYTTIDEARALFARAPEPKQFWAVDGAAHVELVDYAPAEYRRRVLEFLGKYLPLTPR
jgi:fermentation-respiration switch protein FrsA (DUF1100 family)